MRAKLPERLCIFSVGELTLALDSKNLRQVCHGLQPLPLNRVPPYVAGLLQFRGQILTVLDLAVRLSLPFSDIGGGREILVFPDGNEWVGLAVDQVHGLVDVHEERVGHQPDFWQGVDGTFLHCTYHSPDGTVGVLSLDEILTLPYSIHPLS